MDKENKNILKNFILIMSGGLCLILSIGAICLSTVVRGGEKIMTSTVTSITKTPIRPSSTYTQSLSHLFTDTPVPFITTNSESPVRSGPGYDYPESQSIPKNSQYRVFMASVDGYWLSLDVTNSSWINIESVTLNTDISSLPIAPTPTATFTPENTSTPTKTPTITPVPPVLLDYIYYNLEIMTDLQFKEYLNSIIGKKVDQKVIINNVNNSGIVTLSGKWNEDGYYYRDLCVAVQNVPQDIAIKINGGVEYKMKATINGMIGNYNYFSNCKNTLILVYESITR